MKWYLAAVIMLASAFYVQAQSMKQSISDVERRAFLAGIRHGLESWDRSLGTGRPDRPDGSGLGGSVSDVDSGRTTMRIYGGTRLFGGRPPFLPLRRAASALAFDVTLPPLRPRATAAGFLRGTALLSALLGAGVVGVHLRLTLFQVCAVARSVITEVQAVDAGFPCGEGFAALAFGGDLVGAEPLGCHGLIKPNRLGFVN